jgi:hypothetical protein
MAEQYLAISPYNKEHYFVAFRDRTIKYNFIGAPAEWMQQMQEVFAQWQAEIAQQQLGVSPFTPPIQQQWATVPAQPPHTGYMSPHLLPNSPMSTYSNASPLASPNMQPAAVFKHQAGTPQVAPVEMMGSLPIEMMGSLPQGQPNGSMLAAPMPQPPVQVAPPEVSGSRSLGCSCLMLTTCVEEATIPFQDL